MLALASELDKDEDLRRVIAGVNGVSVRSFHFPGVVSYDPAIMESINQQYRKAGCPARSAFPPELSRMMTLVVVPSSQFTLFEIAAR